MELNERIAFVRKSAGLTQEQLGERLDVTRQAVSKWEAGQTVPDAVTVARLCEQLHVSADYVLLGKEPEDSGASPPPYTPPAECPCCGRSVSGGICSQCGYPQPTQPPHGPRYAVAAASTHFYASDTAAQQLVKYRGLSAQRATDILTLLTEAHVTVVLGRNMTDSAAQWLAAHLDPDVFQMRIVEDLGEPDDEQLLTKQDALEPQTPVPAASGGIGFWGVVGAVIVALLILSFL